jgi:hypothetical protein
VLLGVAQAAKQFQSLYRMFLGTDATQVEINPLAVAYVKGGPKKGPSRALSPSRMCPTVMCGPVGGPDPLAVLGRDVVCAGFFFC